MVIATISLNLVDQIFDRVNWSFKTLYGEKGGEVCLIIIIIMIIMIMIIMSRFAV